MEKPKLKESTPSGVENTQAKPVRKRVARSKPIGKKTIIVKDEFSLAPSYTIQTPSPKQKPKK